MISKREDKNHLVDTIDWKKLNLQMGDAVLVDWEDHCSSCESWTPISEHPEFEICFIRSAGLVVFDGEETLKLALNMQYDGSTISQAINIIKSCVTEVHVLKRAKEEKAKYPPAKINTCPVCKGLIVGAAGVCAHCEQPSSGKAPVNDGYQEAEEEETMHPISSRMALCHFCGGLVKGNAVEVKCLSCKRHTDRKSAEERAETENRAREKNA